MMVMVLGRKGLPTKDYAICGMLRERKVREKKGKGGVRGQLRSALGYIILNIKLICILAEIFIVSTY